jgi:hypothetical protein
LLAFSAFVLGNGRDVAALSCKWIFAFGSFNLGVELFDDYMEMRNVRNFLLLGRVLGRD